MNETKFSVLISIYGKEKPEYFRKSLESVFNQTLSADEVVLVEDGPLTEDLYEVASEFERKHPELKRVPLKENRGLGKALNEGLKHCSYPLVARMDTDDVAIQNRFSLQIEFMSQHPDVDISSGWINEFNGDIDNVTAVKRVPATHEEISKYIKRRNPLNHPAVIFRKEAVEKAGSYQDFLLFEDWYLWARMMVNGAKFANLQMPLLYFRSSPEMYRRRGGWKYALDSSKFQWTLHKLGLISAYDAIKSGLIRGSVYIMPNSVRAFIYSKFLRH